MMLQRLFRGVVRRSTAPSPTAGSVVPLSRQQRWRARGQALPLLAIMLVALIGFTGLALDVSMLLLRTLQQQRAADAAALAGVIELPTHPDQAKTLAQHYAGLNGYVNNLDPTGFPQVDARQVPGYNTRLHVIIVAEDDVYFMRIFGFNKIPVTRDAYAQYSLPVRLGCPHCVSFGVGNPTPVAVGNDLANPYHCPNCQLTNEKFWLAIDGPGSDDRNGDANNTKVIHSENGFNCGGALNASPANSVYVPVPNPSVPPPNAGYNYGIHVDPSGGDIGIYVYDPAQYYRSGAFGTGPDTGDTQQCAPLIPTQYRFTTYFQLYYPDDTPDLFTDDVPLGTPRAFRDGDAVDPHNKWFLIGTLPSGSAAIGDFRLQVYTNDSGSDNNDSDGQNGYSLALGGPRQPNNVETIYGINNLSLTNNIRVVGGTNINWYLAQISTDHAREKMSIQLFDPGDAQCNTNMQVFRESDPNNPVDFDLNWTGVHQTRLVTTDVTTYPTPGDPRRQPYNGQWVTLGITLPTNYTTDYWLMKYTIGGCGSTTQDRTVWQIVMLGNPIHLVNNGN